MAEGELTISKYAKWISLVTKEFQKLYPDVTRKTTANAGAAGSALSVRANVDQDKPVMAKRKFGQATQSTQRVSFRPQQATVRNNRNNAHATANQPAGGVCNQLWEDIRGVMRPCTGTTPCSRRHGKRAPARANLARQATGNRFNDTDLDNGHDDFDQEWEAHDHDKSRQRRLPSPTSSVPCPCEAHCAKRGAVQRPRWRYRADPKRMGRYPQLTRIRNFR